MSEIYQPRSYQEYATRRIKESPMCGPFIDMGLGKTVATLTAFAELLTEGKVKIGLIIAPKLVAETVWKQEAAKWQHTCHLRVSVVLGTPKQRLEALAAEADLYVINRENVVWLVGLYASKRWPFEMTIVDESSSFKNHDSKRFKALRKYIAASRYRVILTGTPIPQNYLDLWAQVYLLDQGERLGKTITVYRDAFFDYNPYTYRWTVKQNTSADAAFVGEDYYAAKIIDQIGDICFSMKTEDYLQLPERLDTIQWAHLPADVMEQYREFEREQILQVMDNVELTAFNAGTLAMKLVQFSNGAVYYDERKYQVIHDVKLNALVETVDSLNGAPVLIFYQFQHDLARLLAALKSYKPRVLKGTAEVDDWNARRVQVMIAHPASAGHGLNLQHGGNRLEWFGIPRSSEQYQQGYKRVHRSGQDQIVTNNKILCPGTIDEKALLALQGKITLQDALLDAVKAMVGQARNQYFAV